MDEDKNKLENTQNLLENDNQDEIEAQYHDLELNKDRSFEEELNNFDDPNDETKKNPNNQEEFDDKYNVSGKKEDSSYSEKMLPFDQKNEVKRNHDNQEEKDEQYNELAKKDCPFEKVISNLEKKFDDEINEVKKNKSEVPEIKSTGVDSTIEEKKNIMKKVIDLEEKNKVKNIIKNTGDANIKSLNSSTYQNQKKGLNLESSPNQPEKLINENIILIPEIKTNFDSESILIGNKIKRENESQVQDKTPKEDLLSKCIGDEIPENQINNYIRVISNRARHNIPNSPQEESESVFLTRNHVSSGTCQYIFYTNSDSL